MKKGKKAVKIYSGRILWWRKCVQKEEGGKENGDNDE